MATFFVDGFAVGCTLDVFVVNPSLGLAPSQITFNALVPEPGSLSLLGNVAAAARRRRQR